MPKALLRFLPSHMKLLRFTAQVFNVVIVVPSPDPIFVWHTTDVFTGIYRLRIEDLFKARALFIRFREGFIEIIGVNGLLNLSRISSRRG